MSETDDLLEVSKLLHEMEPDALHTMLYLAERLMLGQRAYGKLDLRTDPRNWKDEQKAEIGDLLVYFAFEELKRQLSSSTNQAEGEARALCAACGRMRIEHFINSRGVWCGPGYYNGGLFVHQQPSPTGQTEGKVVCHRPPAGWYCTREAHHEGPCAARPSRVGHCPVTMGTSLLPCIRPNGHMGNHLPDSTVPDYIPRPNTWDTHG